MTSMSEKALQFAICKHQNQVRKSEKDKPYIIHPMTVGNILKENQCDDDVVAAGYLHDTVEDTDTTLSEIEREFNSHIAYLVETASESDKSLSWEERKQETINKAKNLPLENKYIICADKISNLTDLYRLFKKNGKRDFSSFNRGEEQQKWYYESLKDAFNTNESFNQLFLKYDELVSKIFTLEENKILSNIFEGNEELYKRLESLHAYKEEILDLRKITKLNHPYVIEFTGTPRTGKTSCINSLVEFFTKGGFNVYVIPEFTTSKFYKEEVKPKYLSTASKCKEIVHYITENIKDSIKNAYDIIIIDRGLNDRLIWNYMHESAIYPYDYETMYDSIMKNVKANLDELVITYVDANTSVKRDYLNSLSLEKRNFINEENISKFNNSLSAMYENFYPEPLFITTDKKDIREEAIQIAEDIMPKLRKRYINEIKNKYGIK